ncbi:uncharacterized protein LOC144211613 isoform X2 [Stigmatopora nigra]
MTESDEDEVLQSWGWTHLCVSNYWSEEPDWDRELATMSRRSLRLDDSLLYGNASSDRGGSGWRDTRMLKHRRSQQFSASCSESLLGPKSHQFTNQSIRSHSDASDASLISSLLNDSSICKNSVQENVTLDSFWETTITEEQSMVANSTLIGCDSLCQNHTVQTLTGFGRKDRESRRAGLSSSTEGSTIYTGSQSRRAAAGSLQKWSDSLLIGAKRAAACCQSTLAHVWQVDSQLRAWTGLGGDMEDKQRVLQSSGSLCKPAVLDGVFKWIGKQWSKIPKLKRFPLLLIFILLFLCGLCWFGLEGPPGLSILDLRTILDTHMPVSDDVSSNIKNEAAAEETKKEGTAVSDSARLASMENSLATLWERVEASGRQAEQMQGELIQGQSRPRGSGENSGLWLSSLVKHQVDKLRKQMDQDRQRREKEFFQQQSQTSRMEENFHNLATQYRLFLQETTSKQEANVALSTVCENYSVAVHCQSHDVLLAEFARLEATLKDIRRDVNGLLGCQQLDQETILDQVSARVHKEVRTLLYGNSWGDQTADSQFSKRYVREADLRASLAELEYNISRHLDQCHSKTAFKEVHGKALTRKEADLMIKNALRLFSHDQTGLADYALESGGGTILSTRCSETYKTKAALISLFGIPLWYFSQSPRVVIQPNVQPGNCWAFQGNKGFLVIRLSMNIIPTAFSLEHIPKALAPSGTLRSAPRDFQVYVRIRKTKCVPSFKSVCTCFEICQLLQGLDDSTQERGTLLGSYIYDEDGEALQTFYVTENERAFQIIEVQVLSNWGHSEYTCMYRFRVHGSPSDA